MLDAAHSRSKFPQETFPLFSCQTQGGYALNNSKYAKILKVRSFQLCIERAWCSRFQYSSISTLFRSCFEIKQFNQHNLLKNMFTLHFLTKSCCWPMKRHWDFWPPEEMNSILGQKQGLIAQSFCVIKFYWSIEEIEKASDIDIRRGQRSYIPTGRLLIRERKHLKTQRVAPGLSSATCILA